MGRDGTRNCDEGTVVGRRVWAKGEGERGRRIDERERWEVGELAKINIPYRTIASDNVDDRPELARQKASFSNDSGKPMTTCVMLYSCTRTRQYADVTLTNYRGRINCYVN